MKSITYHCRFCKKEGSTSYDETIVTAEHLARWTPYIACVRCAKFYESRRPIMDVIKACCMGLIQSKFEKPENKDELRGAIRTKLLNQTAKLTDLIGGYVGLDLENDPALTDSLLSKPQLYSQICGKYFNSFRKQVA